MLTKQQIKSAGSIFYASSAGCNPSLKVIELLAESLQYATTEPGAPLTRDEEDELLKRPFIGGGAISEINAVLAKRNTAQPIPIPSVAQADWEDQHGHRSEIVPLVGGEPVKKEQPARVGGGLAEMLHRAFMSAPDKPWDAVVRVIADALLGPLSDEEWYAPDDGKTIQATRYGVDQILANRRKLLDAEPQTLEEQIADLLCESLGHASGTYNIPKISAKIAELAKEQK
jgi:hypothetical protein